MCGIVGIIGNSENGIEEPMHSLKRLEYRGYDSFGFATNNGFLEKRVGNIGDFDASGLGTASRVFICHTRWSTHGAVTEANAHPHLSCDGEIAIVHNGIIENYQELKKELEEKGHRFRSETDSEVIAHFFEQALSENMSIEEAVPEFMQRTKGTFAALMIRKGEDRIYAMKRDSPLVLGLLENGFMLASDIYAFSDRTNRAVFFGDDEFAVVGVDGYEFFDSRGRRLDKEIQDFEWSRENETKENYEHFMMKEIMEQPEACRRLIKSLQSTQKEKIERLKDMIVGAKNVMFVSGGTSYHASLLGVYLLKQAGINTQSVIASEFQNYAMPDRDTVVIAITQSGETMDVIEALKYVKNRGSRIVSIVNVPYSTIQRMSELSVEVMAGQEVCVAATKSFTNQVTLLLYLASMFGFETDIERMPDEISETIRLNEEKIKKLASELCGRNDIYVIGRGLSYPVAREIALKIKEISYIHAEGMMGGELKHGTIALIEKGTPVISLISNNNYDMLSNTKEVESRGARIITASNSNEADLKIPSNDNGKFGILATVLGQMLAYYMALEKGLPIDRPRNLAKSVTVK